MQGEDEVEMLLKKASAAAEMEARMEIENLKKDKEIRRRSVANVPCFWITADIFLIHLEWMIWRLEDPKFLQINPSVMTRMKSSKPPKLSRRQWQRTSLSLTMTSPQIWKWRTSYRGASCVMKTPSCVASSVMGIYTADVAGRKPTKTPNWSSTELKTTNLQSECLLCIKHRSRWLIITLFFT